MNASGPGRRDWRPDPGQPTRPHPREAVPSLLQRWRAAFLRPSKILPMSSRVRWTFGIVFVLMLVFRVAYVAPGEFLLGYHANEDALTHMVVTSNLIAGGHAELGLPVFTFPGESNRGIDNLPGAGRFSPDGRFYYTSFPPGSFLLTAGIGKLAGLRWTPFSARCLAIILHLAVALLTAGLVREIARSLGSAGTSANDSARVAFMLTFTTFELARSYTFSLWGQHWIQLPLLLVPWLFLRNSRGWLFHLLVLVMPLIEWTGYVANAGLFFVLLADWRIRRGWQDAPPAPSRRFPADALAVFLLTLAAGCVQAVWFGGLLGFEAYFSALADRREFRGTDALSLVKLPFATLISLGPLLLVPALWIWKSRRTLPVTFKTTTASILANPVVAFALAMLLLPCVENLLLSNHALTYSFDRIKVCSFCIVLFCALPFLLKKRNAANRHFAVMASVVCVMNTALFAVYTARIYRDREKPGKDTLTAATHVRDRIPRADQVLVNDNVRAAFLYYAGRNVQEESSPIPDPAAYLKQLPPMNRSVHLVIPHSRTDFVRECESGRIRSIGF